MYKSRVGECFEGANSDHGYIETDPTGRYGRFKDVLGRGAMKTVYRAFDEVLGMEVAWNQAKLNDVLQSPDELQRLYSEVHLLSTLNHDSIIRFHTSWIDVERRSLNFITEMFTSGTLREYRHKYKRVDIRAVKNWARQILHGLVYLHGHDPPVIHRDLKCDNVFVNGHLGQVKIGDLGLAAILRGSQPAHSVIGTPEFMAPELYEEEYNELVDIYSFGMCVLEMLTAEYPYSECSNPAQIYKKVTSGKLPEAFYRIHDMEARQFVGKCLETASKRLPAKELLHDPFLVSDDGEVLLPAVPKINGNQKVITNEKVVIERLPVLLDPLIRADPTRSSDMKITGKMNPEDDTIFLKVQIADEDGCVKHIYFPFDIQSDTPIDVATEMVKELEITDREPFEIAEMIYDEISALVPSWKDWDSPQEHPDHILCYQNDDDGDDAPHHPFYASSCSSSQVSLSGLHPSHGTHFHHADDIAQSFDWLQGDLFIDEDASSESSEHSGKYSNMNYNEQDFDMNTRRRDNYPIAKTTKCTRFCHKENPANCYRENKLLVEPHRASGSNNQKRIENRRMARMQSFMDIRSQLLHRSLVEEVNRRRLFKTVGAVENIGFQAPCEFSRKASIPNGSCHVRTSRDGKKNGFKW